LGDPRRHPRSVHDTCRRDHLLATPCPLIFLLGPLIRGAVVQLSNPKAAIVYASVFAALLPSSPPVWLYIALPLSIFVVEAGWYSLVSLGLSHSRIRVLYARGKKWVDRAASAFLAALGLRLLLTASDRGI
ncbi:LysE family translocator, partial [Nonomuraea dietziae]